MSKEQRDAGKSYLWFVVVGLLLYCVVLTAVTGDIGFDGDDWWVLSYPYWHSFSDSVVLYARRFLRPVEGLYWISLFEIFGFNKVAFHLCSLLLLAGSAALMGLSLDRAFPGRQTCVSIAVLLAFFLPPVSCLTYVMFTDNSRLSMLLFWTSVLAFQRWAHRSLTWRGLALPVTLYVVSFLTYEAASFLILVVPLLVWPVYRRHSDRSVDKAFLIKLGLGILTAFVTALSVRFLFLKGGAVEHSFLLPPLELVWSYLALFPFYLVSSFSSLPEDSWALAMGFLVVLGTAGLFILSNRSRPEAGEPAKRWFEPGSLRYLVVLGGGIFILGMLPYQLAGYGIFSPRMLETVMAKCGLIQGGDLSWFNFSWASRIYSSASFGVAILLAAGLSACQKPLTKLLAKTTAVAVIGSMAVFHAGLSVDWKEAAKIRNDLVLSMVSQVPDVRSGTNFVFLDLPCSHKRAEVIRRENGIRELISMLYSNPTLGAWYVYPDAYSHSGHLFQQAVAKPEGFMSRGQKQDQPAPHESLLLFRRCGRELVLLDKITAQDRSVATGIAWSGVEQLSSNFERIEAWSPAISPEARLARNAWTSGLIATLHLRQLKSTVASLRGPRYVAISLRRALRRHLLKMRLYRSGRRISLVPR